MEPEFLEIKGAAVHNLKNLHLRIPKKRLVVFTGVSGSGKSSLAFDTLYAEGQRRYVESLSAYARQFLGQMEKPPYDSIRGLAPTISIEQKAASSNPRSTVGTITEINDYLRVLFARAGVQHCVQCGARVGEQTVDQITDELLALGADEELTLCAPLFEQRKGEHREVLHELAREGFARVRVDGQLVRALDVQLDRKKKHDLDLVIDRLRPDPAERARLADSVEQALRRGDGVLTVAREGHDDMILSERNACHRCRISYPELTPQLFSFNSPLGMCPACDGLGRKLEIDPKRVVPDETRTLADGAVLPWRALDGAHDGVLAGRVMALCRAAEISLATPWGELPDWQRDFLLFARSTGAPSERQGALRRLARGFEGVVPMLSRRFHETGSDAAKTWYARFLDTTRCHACDGSRLKPAAAAVRVGDLSFTQIARLTIRAAHEYFTALALPGARAKIARELVKEIRNRLGFLQNVGLDYLSLEREGPSLSGGESQRIRLASQVGSELTGVLYILDEPSIGLHQRDNDKLLATLAHLRDIGNTVIVVEHDRETIERADFVVDFGLGAGVKGGRVVVAGSVDEVRRHPTSLTGKYLSGRETIPLPRRRRPVGTPPVAEPGEGEPPGEPRGRLQAPGSRLRASGFRVAVPLAGPEARSPKPSGDWLVIRGAREHNLKNLDVAIPLGRFVCVTGVSGAGKSSLVNGLLHPALARLLHGARRHVGAHDRIDGLNRIDKVVDIDQKPIGRTPRSNPATYVKVFDLIRELFALGKEARLYGFPPGRFSFNVKGGRCEACQGDGMIRVEMHFLADVFVPCEVCRGRRFNQQTLKVTYQGKNISEVLDLTVAEAARLFRAHPRIARDLETLADVGLDYLRLGQPSPTLSGGEAQRVKLSRELSKIGTGRTMYLLDEPTTGLHFDDIRKLLRVLGRLVDAGNTVVVIEHHLDVIKHADWIIDLGPEGGEQGGYLIAQGPPEEVARVPASFTGQFLKKVLGRRAKGSGVRGKG